MSTGTLTNRELSASVCKQELEISLTEMCLERMKQHRWELSHELYKRVNTGVIAPDDTSESESPDEPTGAVKRGRSKPGEAKAVVNQSAEIDGEKVKYRRTRRKGTDNRPGDSRSPSHVVSERRMPGSPSGCRGGRKPSSCPRSRTNKISKPRSRTPRSSRTGSPVAEDPAGTA